MKVGTGVLAQSYLGRKARVFKQKIALGIIQKQGSFKIIIIMQAQAKKCKCLFLFYFYRKAKPGIYRCEVIIYVLKIFGTIKLIQSFVQLFNIANLVFFYP